jgi:hypothetical protein
MAAALPGALQWSKAFEWTRTPAEAISDILAAARLVSSDYRVFISYRQEDGQQHADDLFEALTGRGFDVFLDRVRIAPGANIPDRIREELSHKSILLVLETPLVGDSEWVRKEVAIAVASRLGIIAEHFPKGTRVASLSNRRRHVLTASDFQSTGKLSDAMVDDICRRVADSQNLWLVRRRYQMQRALSNALLYRGVTNQRLTPNGCLDVVPAWSPGRACSIKTTPRLAALEDFRELDESAAAPFGWSRAVIAPGTFVAGERQADMRWLADNLKTGLFDESEIRHVSDMLATSTTSELRK